MRASSGRVRSLISLMVSAILLLGALWIALNQQFVIDKITVMQYDPSTEIKQLTKDVNFTDKGKFYFYAAQPVIDGTAAFNSKCERQEKESAILGCYVDNFIYIYDIDSKKLVGVETVTAAHEMLHVVYNRMSESEKAKVDRLLKDEYSTLNDADLKKRMEYYERTEPGEKYNELHSIIATEFSDLSPELEQYYSKYFDDRQKIVSLHEGYSSQFKELAQKREALSAELKALASDIKKLSDQYNSEVDALNNDIVAFNNRANSGGFSSQSQFQIARNRLLERSGSLDGLRSQIDTKVKTYEIKRLEYNATVDEANKLHKSLDSSLAPAPSL